METDSELLTCYVSQNAQDAFAELVRRHIDLVYASARRQVHSSALAEDITQGVFLMLSQKAARLRSGVILPAWLLTATWYASKNALRKEHRRRIHEQRAAQMNTEARTPTSPPGQFDPMLDDALASLSTSDRAVVALHYLQGKDFSEIAAQLSTTPEAARKRSERAVDKLRSRFHKMGTVMTAPAVGNSLRIASAITAPAHLRIKIAPAAAGASATLIAKGALIMMMYSKLRIAAAVGLVIMLCVSGLIAAEKIDANKSVNAQAAAPAAADEPKDPRSALTKLAKAIREGDIEGVRAGIVASDPADQPLIDMQAKTCKTIAEFKSAYGKAFGAAAESKLPLLVGPVYVPANSPVKIDGDKATVTLSGIPLPMVKVRQTWKLPSNAMGLKSLPMPVDKLVEYNRHTDIAIAETTEAITLGQFQNAQEAVADLQARIQKAAQAMAKEKPTTVPATAH